jgi:tetratricopeptide (TPR) repeat protein
MSFFDNLFSRKKPEAKPAPPAPFKPTTLPPRKDAPADPSKDPNMIQVFDAYGREMFITKEAWRTNVLPGTIKSNWNNPDQLYGIIIGSLNDGFRADVVDAARQLYRTDPQPVRGACVWGIVLMEEGRLDEAEKVFRDFISKHGENGVILTNLAKVHSKRNDETKAEEILWHALEVDPNQDNGMGWYWILHKERGGEAAGEAALRRVAAIPNSWRAQAWLARTALQSRDLERALALYNEILTRVGKPVPTDLLMQMSGDLGNTGHLPEILQLVEPHFDATVHGLQVGNNLIKAHLDLGQIDAARRILNRLYALNRMDWKQHLSFWDTEIAKTKIASAPVEQKELKMAMLTGDSPVWLKPSSPAAELFPAKSSDALVVAFLGCSAEIASNSKRVERQMADAPGRLSRALPLFFAEQVEFNTRARIQTLAPWIMNDGGGFVLSGGAWKDEEAATYARQSQTKSDYVVTSHLKTQAEPWIAELRLVRTIDGKCLGTLNGSFPSAKPQAAIPDLARQLVTLLAQQAEVESQPVPSLYHVPAGEQFPYYLLRLEQLLAVRCGGMDGVPPGFLSGEREIIDGNLQLCLAYPGNVGTRILLAQTLLAMKKARPDILPEYREKMVLLQKEKPLPEPAHGVVQRMFNEALAA